MLLEVKDLKKYYPVKSGFLRAVDGVSVNVDVSTTLGLVGESGCGKSTTGRSILRLIEPTSGEVWLEGRNICGFDGKGLRDCRKKMQIIYQDPFGSLNPKRRIENIVAEPLDNFGLARGKERRDRVIQLLTRVGLQPEHLLRYPGELSGGQTQRVGIARALALQPKLIVCDEPVSSLDVSIQAQVLNLLKDLQEEYGISYIFISHDLSVIQHISHRIAVMYLGKIVELAGVREFYESPLHPYSKALVASVPVPDPNVERRRPILEGDDLSSSLRPQDGCSFHPRCSLFKSGRGPSCKEGMPPLREVQPGHWVACHLRS